MSEELRNLWKEANRALAAFGAAQLDDLDDRGWLYRWADDLDRLQIERDEACSQLAECQKRVREPTNAIEEHRDSAVTVPVLTRDEKLHAALNAPAEDGRT